MKALHIVSDQGPGDLRLVEVAEPTRAAGEIKVEVHAAGVSFPEVLQSKGLYQHQPELPFIPGAEVAGVVVEADEGSGHRPGDRVVALAKSGGYAEVAVADAERVFRLPDSVGFELGAAIPGNYLTCHFAMLRRAGLRAGETVLVHGAAGGVGCAAVQLAVAYGAERVIAVVSSDEKAEFAAAAGATDCVRPEEFLDFARGLGGVDLVVDPVGGDRFTDSLRALRVDGRVAVVGFAAGTIPEVKVNRLLLNNLSVVGAGWGAYLVSYPGLAQQQWEEILPHVQSGVLVPPRVSPYPLAEASRALIDLEERRIIGKAVLTR